MRKMKDSGVAWIGEMPEDWTVKRGKFTLKLLNRPVKETDDVITCFRDGEVTLRTNRRTDGFTVSVKEIGYQGIEPGDLVIHGMDGFAGSIGISDSRGKSSPVLVVCDTDENKRYIMYYLRSMAYNDVFTALATGIRVRSCDLRWNKLAELPYILPSLEEQNQIVLAIESSTSKVDALISNVQAQIEKLKAYKQSLITEVVTKGLDPNVPMKDSGVEWIGEIPKCWNMVRGKALFEECDARSDDGSEELLTVSQYTGVTPRSQKSVNMFESTTLEGYKICEVGDIAANTMWLWAGAIGVSEYRGVISPSYNVYRQKEIKYISSYLDCLLRIPLLVQEYASRSTGIRASRLRLYPKDFMDIMFPVPPIEEQKTIMDILGKKIDMVNQMISIKQSKIEKLELYKRSLIYEYVTGKKEVS
jgi:type I restriction enzyme S subunit